MAGLRWIATSCLIAMCSLPLGSAEIDNYFPP
ncbi:MAG: hypothetical protein QOJ99_2505, partial [Bryobacterales bacterium]|nr:hypothetical protein [Bryobacterales bacterium]